MHSTLFAILVLVAASLVLCDKVGAAANAVPGATEEALIKTWKPQLDPRLLRRSHPGSGRVVGIGDLHGDIDAAKEIFRIAQVTDDRGHWAAGTDCVVQMGDVLDRGPHGFLIIDFIRRLRNEARRAGGELVMILGNHEAMNFFGDFRFVHPKIVESVGGIANYAALVQKGGKYGDFIAQLPIGVVRNGTLFVHAGMTETNVRQFGTIDDMNALLRATLETQERNAAIVGEHGPVWTRQNVYSVMSQHGCATTERALGAMSMLEQSFSRPPIFRIVVGHTIMTEGEPRAFCEGKLFAIDVQMSAYFGIGGGYLAYYEQLPQSLEGVQPITLFTLPRGAWAGHPPLWFPSRNGSVSSRIVVDDAAGEADAADDDGTNHHRHHRVKMVAVKHYGGDGAGGVFRGTLMLPVVGVAVVVTAALVYLFVRTRRRNHKLPSHNHHAVA